MIQKVGKGLKDDDMAFDQTDAQQSNEASNNFASSLEKTQSAATFQQNHLQTLELNKNSMLFVNDRKHPRHKKDQKPRKNKGKAPEKASKTKGSPLIGKADFQPSEMTTPKTAIFFKKAGKNKTIWLQRSQSPIGETFVF